MAITLIYSYSDSYRQRSRPEPSWRLSVVVRPNTQPCLKQRGIGIQNHQYRMCLTHFGARDSTRSSTRLENPVESAYIVKEFRQYDVRGRRSVNYCPLRRHPTPRSTAGPLALQVGQTQNTRPSRHRRRRSRKTAMVTRIKEVWAENLEDEMTNIRDAIQKYPFVAMVRGLGIITVAQRDYMDDIDWAGFCIQRTRNSPASSRDRLATFGRRQTIITRRFGGHLDRVGHSISTGL
jgi:hypothetical protein